VRPRFIADVWTFPVPGVTGWVDRAEGPAWVHGDRYWPGKRFRGRSLVPYCVFSLNTYWPPRPGAVANNPPCRHTAGFPCCRMGQIRGERHHRWRDC
jgi:hypothetical protein